MKITAEKGYGASFTVKMDSYLASEPKVLRDHARLPERGWHVHIYDIADVELSLHGSSKEIRQFADILSRAAEIIAKREAGA